MADEKPQATKEAPAAPSAAPEVVKNCAGCNKPMKKAKRFYRNGKYYCNKKCFKSAGKEPEKSQEGPTEKKEPKKE